MQEQNPVTRGDVPSVNPAEPEFALRLFVAAPRIHLATAAAYANSLQSAARP